MSKEHCSVVGNGIELEIVNPTEQVVEVDVKAAGKAANEGAPEKKRRLDDYMEERRYQEMLMEFDRDMYIYPDIG